MKKPKYRVYINLYLKELRYGGPEEGGWYYDQYWPCAGRGFSSLRNRWAKKYMKELRRMAAAENEGRYDYTSVLGGEEHVILVQKHPAEVTPDRRPHYE